jgi:hypothetical protein
VKIFTMIAVTGSMFAITQAQAETVRVKGHVNRNGVYVAPHVRTAPDSRTTNNWESKPNINPYSGKAGTVDPYKPVPFKPFKPRKY